VAAAGVNQEVVPVGDLVFLGGHSAIGVDGSVEHKGDVAAQARRPSRA